MSNTCHMPETRLRNNVEYKSLQKNYYLTNPSRISLTPLGHISLPEKINKINNNNIVSACI